MEPNIKKCPLYKKFKHSSDKLTVAILIGYAGTGKTVFCEEFLIPLGYQHISRDVLGTMKKCHIKMEDALKAGKDVVIDNTNPSRASRANFIKLAKKYGARVVAFKLVGDFELAYQLNKKRKEMNSGHVLPVVVFVKFRMDYEEPTKKEGFDEIYQIE